MFSEKERAARLNAAAELIKAEDLQAIYLLGNGTVGTNTFGNFRYFVDSRVFFNFNSAVITKDARLIGIVGNSMAMKNLTAASFVRKEDVIMNGDQLGGAIGFLKENGLDKGRLGVLMELLPTSWMMRLNKELPDLDLVDVADSLFAIRTHKSEEEAETLRKCGRVCDAAYAAFKKAAVPGAWEHEVVAEVINAVQRMGADTYFMLIASGKFSAKESRLTTLHTTPAIDRQLQQGDTVAMEITPYFNGNWTQMVRTVSVGEENPDVDAFIKVTADSIAEAVKLIKPGVPIKTAVLKMKQVVEEQGYIFDMPCGHICGADLNEERTTVDNDRPFAKGMCVILHPTVINEYLKSGIYWGESYLVTDDGCECLMDI